MKKLAIITTHPIQYYAPVFKRLAKNCDLNVFYTWGNERNEANYDPDFKQHIVWDIPLLEGYTYTYVKNTAKQPGSHHFYGIVNPTLIEEINAFAPDAILVYGWAYQSHLKVLRHFKEKIPIWFRGDSTLLDEQKSWKSVLRQVLLKWVYKHVDKAFYVGAANKAYFEKFGLKPDQLIFAPHAIDNKRFADDRVQEAKSLRERLGIPESELLILFAGKLEQKKDPEILLNAFLEIKKSQVHLLIVGNGDLATRLKSGGINPHVHFMPFQNQSQMPVVYQACDLFCLPSKGPGETWGLAVNEAMAAGKAVLVSDKVGCAKDLVHDGQNGAIFEAGNISALKNKLISLLGKSDQLREMGQQSAHIIEHWTIEKQTQIIINELNATEQH